MSFRTRTAALLGLLLCVLTLLTTPLAPARAQQADPIAIELTSITPSVLTNSGDLVISGTITNTSPDVLQRVEVRLWRDATPLTTLDALNEDPNALPRGAVMESATARQSINAGGDLAPGASAAFTVRADLGPGAEEQLWLSEPDAAYRVGAEVYGWSGNAGYHRLGRSSALIAYPGQQPVEHATIVLLDHRPTLLPLVAESEQRVFVDDRLSGQLTGRLKTLLSLAAQPDVSVLLDPALYDEVNALASPHLVLGADGIPVPGSSTSQTLARDWLIGLDRLIEAGKVSRTLYGGFDVTAAAAANRPDLLGQIANALPADHRLADLPLVVVGPDAQMSQAGLALLGDVQPQLVLANNLAGSDLLQSDATHQVLAVEPTQPASGQSAAVLAGEFSSRQLVGARQGRPLVSLVDSEEGARLVQVADQPWRVRTSVAALRQAATPGPIALGPEPTIEVAPDLVQATDRTMAEVRAWGDLIDDAEIAEAALARMIAGAWSTGLRNDPGARLAWLSLASQPTAELTTPSAIELRINDWVTTSADDNLLPVTVINNTRHAVLVRVQFDSENPLRIRVDDSELVSVQPGESTTVRVRPRTLGNGKVPITAQLVTSGGHPVGAPTSFVITGTEAGRVAWLIIVASGVVLLVATALRVRQVRRETRTDE